MGVRLFLTTAEIGMVTLRKKYRFCHSVTSLYAYYIGRAFRKSNFKLMSALAVTLTMSFDFIWIETRTSILLVKSTVRTTCS